jgi:hypothetical protein
VEIDIDFVRGKVVIGQLHVVHVSTNLQFVDIMTPRDVLEDFSSSLWVLPAAAQTVRGKGVYKLGCQVSITEFNGS